jgi:lysozyme
MIAWLRRLLSPAPEPTALPHVVIERAADLIPPAPADALGAATLPAERLWRGGVPIEAIHLSHAFEGFRAAPYLCPAHVWTIGYGSTRDLFGKPVTRDTAAVTETQAMVMATRDLDQAAGIAAKAFPAGLPKRWGAVVVLMCNNMGAIERWGVTLHRMLLAGQWRDAAHQMRLYRNGAGKPLLGLRRRRWAEAAYALGMDAHEAHRRAWAEINHVDDWPALPM